MSILSLVLMCLSYFAHDSEPILLKKSERKKADHGVIERRNQRKKMIAVERERGRKRNDADVRENAQGFEDYCDD